MNMNEELSEDAIEFLDMLKNEFLLFKNRIKNEDSVEFEFDNFDHITEFKTKHEKHLINYKQETYMKKDHTKWILKITYDEESCITS